MWNYELDEYDLVLHHETDAAWLVSEDGDRESAFWIPKSAARLTDSKDDLAEVGSVCTFSIPNWLAMKRGLL